MHQMCGNCDTCIKDLKFKAMKYRSNYRQDNAV